MSSIASSSRSVLRGSIPRAAVSRPAVRQLHLRASPIAAFPARARTTSSPLCPRQSRAFFSLPDISKLAGTLTGANQSDPSDTEGQGDRSGIESDGETQKFHARKILPYSQAQLYSLVSDVPSYSSFIPFCTSSRVLAPLPRQGQGQGQAEGKMTADGATRGTRDWKPDDQPFDLDAELTVGFGGLEERYTSRVMGRPFDSVTATAAKQSPLFKSLKTTWSFSPASPLSPHSSAATAPASSDSTSRPPNSTEAASPDQGPTLLTIDLAFSFANPLHRIASQAVLPKVADKMVEAFEQRCLEVWGKGRD